MTYDQIERLPGAAFLDWQRFLTGYPSENDPARCQAKYEEGLLVGRQWGEVYINYKGVWGAGKGQLAGNAGASLTSYEGIGYHALTAYFLAGLLDSETTIIVSRNWEYHNGTRTVIRNHAIRKIELHTL